MTTKFYMIYLIHLILLNYSQNNKVQYKILKIKVYSFTVLYLLTFGTNLCTIFFRLTNKCTILYKNYCSFVLSSNYRASLLWICHSCLIYIFRIYLIVLYICKAFLIVLDIVRRPKYCFLKRRKTLK